MLHICCNLKSRFYLKRCIDLNVKLKISFVATKKSIFRVNCFYFTDVDFHIYQPVFILLFIFSSSYPRKEILSISRQKQSPDPETETVEWSSPTIHFNIRPAVTATPTCHLPTNSLIYLGTPAWVRGCFKPLPTLCDTCNITVSKTCFSLTLKRILHVLLWPSALKIILFR